MVVCRPCPPRSCYWKAQPSTTRATTQKCADLVYSVLENDSSTVVRHTRPVHRRHCRGHLLLLHKLSVYLLLLPA